MHKTNQVQSRRLKRWTYQGRPVFIVPTADLAPEFRPDHKLGYLVQRILDGIEPWEPGDDPIEAGHDPQLQLSAIVTLNNGRKPVWGIHTAHKARRPELSPFVHGGGDLEFTSSFTVELAGTTRYPRLTRAYPGTYVPPLPWQASAGDADGGVEYCREFWHDHSYPYERSLIIRGTQTNTVPEWYK